MFICSDTMGERSLLEKSNSFDHVTLSAQETLFVALDVLLGVSLGLFVCFYLVHLLPKFALPCQVLGRNYLYSFSYLLCISKLRGRERDVPQSTVQVLACLLWYHSSSLQRRRAEIFQWKECRQYPPEVNQDSEYSIIKVSYIYHKLTILLFKINHRIGYPARTLRMFSINFYSFQIEEM